MKITKELSEINVKLQEKENPAYALLQEVVCSENKLILFIENKQILNKRNYSAVHNEASQHKNE